MLNQHFGIVKVCKNWPYIEFILKTNRGSISPEELLTVAVHM